ncbi:MAG: phosphoglycerate dehydrogenase [Solirubrobacterales bacterium]
MAKPKVLVKEKIADAGVELLRANYDVEVGVDWSDEDLNSRIGEFDALLVRSATQVDAALIEKATNLKVIGRAGVGVDNIDVPAATQRGIIVANAPESNIVTAAEHTMALLMAVARNVPQAHSALTKGEWARSKYGGVEVYEKTLGILGFGRIGQLVAARARSFGMDIVGYDPFVSAERFRELGVEKADTPEDLYAVADFLTIHLPNTPETKGFLNAEAFSKMKPTARVLNVARGGLIDYDALLEALTNGTIAGAALDVFASEPMTESPLFDLDNVVVTPHLGASTTEAQDRAGVQTAEQIDAALSGGFVSNAVNIPKVGAEDMATLEPFIPLAGRLGTLAVALAEHGSIDNIEISYEGHLANFDTRLLTVAVLKGALEGHTEESVNLVNAPALAEARGISVSEKSSTTAEDFTELIKVSIQSNGETIEVGGTGLGPKNLPRLVLVYGQNFNIEFADHIAFFRYADQPGMLGKVGTIFGEAGVNIDNAVIGAGGESSDAVLAITSHDTIPRELVEKILQLDGFNDGHVVSF